MDGIAARGVVVERGMDEGAVAGTVVGVVVAVALLVFCLYPVIVYHCKRRRHADRPHFDAESAIAAHQGSPPGADLGSHRRLSSSDSFKHDGELSRGDIGAPRSKEYGWKSHHGSVGHAEDGHEPPPPMSSTGPGVTASDRSLATAQYPTGEFELLSSSSPLPFYVGEYMPESEVRDDNPGVLQGTSADYYSPSIPSEAFGMMATPPDLHVDIPPAGRSGSRSSSLRYNVRHMFRRKSSRDNTLDSYTITGEGSGDNASAGVVELHGATALRQIVTSEEPTESPTEVSPTMVLPVVPAAPTPRLTGSPTNLPSVSPPPSSAMTPPQPQLAERSFKHSPSPPACPAPGTVNPMDIMPATTESEVWHRTEHQLFASSCGSPEGFSHPPEHHRNAEYTSIVTSPSPTTSAQPQTAQQAQSPTPTETREHIEQEHAEDHDTAMADAHMHEHLTPSTIPECSRHPSSSEQSFPGPGSTDPSSHNTPSTQIDSPTPESMHGSDFGHSVSPQPGIPSLNNRYMCKEPGCNQVFNQPHKLK